MVEWREKGFVQDSDDDEELDSNDTQNPLQTDAAADSVEFPGREAHQTSEGLLPAYVATSTLEDSCRNEAEDGSDKGGASSLTEPARGGSTIQDVSSPVAAEDVEEDEVDELQQDSPVSQAVKRSPASLPAETRSSQTDAATEIVDTARPVALSVSGEVPPFTTPAAGSIEQELGADFETQERSDTGRQDVQVVIPAATLGAAKGPEANIHAAPTRSNGRVLRQRNPIQLHPYVLESERYRQTLRARGLKPVQVTSQASLRRNETESTETQDQGFDAEESQSSTLQSESQVVRPIPNGSQAISPAISTQAEEDEFPDLAAIARGEVHGAIQHGYKRRKTVHTFSRKGRLPAGDRRTIDSHASAVTENQVVMDVFDVPPSPPTSSLSPAPQLSRDFERPFKFPRGMTPVGMPTPTTSSEARHAPKATTGEQSEDESPPRSTLRQRPDRHRVHSVTLLSSAESSSSETDASDESELRLVQKKIKGVLPASWLKLDQQAQNRRIENSVSNPQRSESPEILMYQKGVARKVSRRITTSTPGQPESTLGDPIVIPDEPNTPSDSDVDRGPSANVQHSTDDLLILNGFDADDVVEEDWIDPMLPSASRQKQNQRSDRKRQLKLTESLKVANKRFKRAGQSSVKVPASRRAKAPGGTKQMTTTRVQKRSGPKAPHLGILDVPQAQETTGKHVPQFIRLAIRQAQRRPDKGRHSPTQKYIRLQTLADTEDANRPLEEWRAGTIAPRQLPSNEAARTDNRSPLQPSVDNRQTFVSVLHQDRGALQPTAHAKVLESHELERLTPADSRLRQSRLHPVLVKRSSTLSQFRSRPSSDHQSSVRAPRQHSLQNRLTYRSAQLEALESDFDVSHRKAAFQRILNRVDDVFLKHLGDNPVRQPQLDRFLADEDALNVMPVDDTRLNSRNELGRVIDSDSQSNSEQPLLASHLVRRPRKRRGRQLDIGTREFRQPSEPLPSVDSVDIDRSNPVHTEKPILLRLGSFGTRYTTDFDIYPLEIGTFFHQTTFVGSGEFRDSLDLKKRDLDVSAGQYVAEFNGSHMRWSSWTEDVASEFTSTFHSLSAEMEALTQDAGLASIEHVTRVVVNIIAFLRSVVRYFSRWLSFLDPIDRRSWVVRVLESLERLFEAVSTASEPISNGSAMKLVSSEHPARILMFLLVLCHQTSRVAAHATVEPDLALRTKGLLSKVAQNLTSIVLHSGMAQIREFFEENRRHVRREGGIRNETYAVECVVVLYHILDCTELVSNSFWDTINGDLLPRVQCINQVQNFERIWYDVFTLLPLLEFDATGLLKLGQRYQRECNNWKLIKVVLDRLFILYPESSRSHSSTLNTYVRALLTRCFRLLQDWGWRKCESVIGTLFDFFAKNGLAPLHNEEVHGSPRFLEVFDQNPVLDVQADDKSFHIFLKTLGAGLRAMRTEYNDKKIRGIAWRFIPNHGRTYRKDEAVRQEDIDALRNHHDLLCTLYWASPPGFRPRADLVRNLVDHTASHREACRLNVRAWANLVKFQLSTDEPASVLEPFALWYKDIVQQTINQYLLARTEAENHYDAVSRLGENTISNELLQQTIGNNQAQVLATLADAIAGMKAAIKVARHGEAATALLQESAFTDIFAIFDAKKPRLNEIIIESLDIISQYVQKFSYKIPTAPSQNINEESQDYGDWPDLEESLTMHSEALPSGPSIGFFQEPLFHLLSNCFGAETPPDDKVLASMVDNWTAMAYHFIQRGQKDWQSYLDPYSSLSWEQLRDTDQTRKYKAYFIGSVLAVDPSSFQEHEAVFLSSWLTALVERESMLKYQHRLTAALLNTRPDHQLFRNLPFIACTRTGRFDISATAFRERRLSLISSILANMRELFEDTMRGRPDILVDLRREYTALLKQFMGAMKKNYLELQQGDIVKGAYVDFVQKVVEFLQQHTSDICPVDKFFTDSAAFPLPATDPLYVVGRLKSYAPKLASSRTIKQLAVFVQTVSERAAIDNQQPYLIRQLHTAMSNEYERNDAARPTLRRVLMQAVFPAYIELSVSTAIGWIVAKPILQASALMFDRLLYDFSVADSQSREPALEIITDTLVTLQRTVELLVIHSGLLEQPHILHILAAIFDTVTATLPCLDYIHRRTRQASTAAQAVTFFKRFGLFVASIILGYPDAHAPYLAEDITVPATQFAEIRGFCVKELGQAIGRDWTKHGEQYFVNRGSMRREVLVDLGMVDQERARVIAAIEGFHAVFGRMEGLGGETDRKRERDGLGLSGVFI